MDAWRLHLRWMRLHIAYFKPFTMKGRKGKQEKMLEELMQSGLCGFMLCFYRTLDSSNIKHAQIA